MTQVLVEWLMDQVPLGNKTPRPGLPRLVHCPACRGLLPYPQALDSGHVLLECFAIEGTKPELASVFLKTIQVQEFVKESEPSLRTAEDWARARRRPTPSSSRGWIQVEPRCQFETTWREELHFLLWPACGFIPGAKKKMSKFDVKPFVTFFDFVFQVQVQKRSYPFLSDHHTYRRHGKRIIRPRVNRRRS